MRVLKEFRFGQMKFSIFSFNEKWILKTEVGLCEQTFKFSHEDFSIEQVEEVCQKQEFQNRVHTRFQNMHEDIQTFSANE